MTKIISLSQQNDITLRLTADGKKVIFDAWFDGPDDRAANITYAVPVEEYRKKLEELRTAGSVDLISEDISNYLKLTKNTDGKVHYDARVERMGVGGNSEKTIDGITF